MNRFYCVVCNKVKRVQHYPSNITNRESEVVTERRGACKRHNVHNIKASYPVTSSSAVSMKGDR